MNASGRAGLILIAAMTLVAILGPLVVGDPLTQNLSASLTPPSRGFLLGADQLGRSLLARVVWGARISLGLALIAVIGASLVGTTLGVMAAWTGGPVDWTIGRLADLFLAFPGILLLIVFSGLLGGSGWVVALAVALVSWPDYCRLSRAITRVALARPHAEAARLFDLPRRRILVHAILPDLVPHILSLGALGIASAVLSIATLGFVGVGLHPPTPEWGAMVNELLPFFLETPWQVLVPPLAIFATVLGFTLAGQWLSSQPAV